MTLATSGVPSYAEQRERIAELETEISETMLHLRNVLHSVSDVPPADRCRAIDDAVAHYNARRPDAQITFIEDF